MDFVNRKWCQWCSTLISLPLWRSCLPKIYHGSPESQWSCAPLGPLRRQQNSQTYKTFQTAQNSGPSKSILEPANLPELPDFQGPNDFKKYLYTLDWWQQLWDWLNIQSCSWISHNDQWHEKSKCSIPSIGWFLLF